MKNITTGSGPAAAAEWVRHGAAAAARGHQGGQVTVSLLPHQPRAQSGENI